MSELLSILLLKNLPEVDKKRNKFKKLNRLSVYIKKAQIGGNSADRTTIQTIVREGSQRLHDYSFLLKISSGLRISYQIWVISPECRDTVQWWVNTAMCVMPRTCSLWRVRACVSVLFELILQLSPFRRTVKTQQHDKRAMISCKHPLVIWGGAVREQQISLSSGRFFVLFKNVSTVKNCSSAWMNIRSLRKTIFGMNCSVFYCSKISLKLRKTQ